MKTIPVLLAFVLLAATTFDVRAQSAQSVEPTTEEEVGHTGTDTATVSTEEDVGHTGTDTATVPVPTGENVGHTGPDTRVPDGPSPWTLVAKSSSIASPGSVVVSVTMPADAGSQSAGESFTVPLTSSEPACVLPESVTLDWTASGGGKSAIMLRTHRRAKWRGRRVGRRRVRGLRANGHRPRR